MTVTPCFYFFLRFLLLPDLRFFLDFFFDFLRFWGDSSSEELSDSSEEDVSDSEVDSIVLRLAFFAGRLRSRARPLPLLSRRDELWLRGLRRCSGEEAADELFR